MTELSEENKNKIRLEELYRREFRDSIVANVKKSGIPKILNEPFVLWLLSSVAIGLITFAYTNFNQYFKTKSERNAELHDAEMLINMRFSAADKHLEYYERGSYKNGADISNNGQYQSLAEIDTILYANVDTNISSTNGQQSTLYLAWRILSGHKEQDADLLDRLERTIFNRPSNYNEQDINLVDDIKQIISEIKEMKELISNKAQPDQIEYHLFNSGRYIKLAQNIINDMSNRY